MGGRGEVKICKNLEKSGLGLCHETGVKSGVKTHVKSGVKTHFKSGVKTRGVGGVIF